MLTIWKYVVVCLIDPYISHQYTAPIYAHVCYHYMLHQYTSHLVTKLLQPFLYSKLYCANSVFPWLKQTFLVTLNNCWIPNITHTNNAFKLTNYYEFKGTSFSLHLTKVTDNTYNAFPGAMRCRSFTKYLYYKLFIWFPDSAIVQ